MGYTPKQAAEILGISTNATKNDLEKRYDIILKKYKAMKSDGSLDDKAEQTFKDQTDAYRILMGYEVNDPAVQRKETSTDKALEKVGLDRGKVGNFFYYHKYHIIAILLAVIAVFFVAKEIITKVEPDAQIGLMGEVYQDDFDKLKDRITEKIPELKEIQFDSSMMSNNFSTGQDYAYIQKAQILLLASDIDVFILNKYAYDFFVQNGAFMNLDEYVKKYSLDVSKSEGLKERVVDEWETPDDNTTRKPKSYIDSEPKLYGIDISDNKIFQGIENVVGPEKILVVRAVPHNKELADKLVEVFVNYEK